MRMYRTSPVTPNTSGNDVTVLKGLVAQGVRMDVGEDHTDYVKVHPADGGPEFTFRLEIHRGTTIFVTAAQGVARTVRSAGSCMQS